MSKKKNKQKIITSPVLIRPAVKSIEEKTEGEYAGKNLMKYKFWYLAFSAVVIIPGLLALGVFGLRTSIDFTGGSVLKFSRQEGTWDKNSIEQVFKEKNVEIASINFDNAGKSFSVRTKPIDANKNEELKTTISSSPSIEQTSFETVGPSIGGETAKKSLVAFVIACFGIVFFIAYAFRNVPQPFSGLRFGISAIIAMMHDALVVLGIFAILGHYKGVEIDPMFITALLTIIGFSVHDTIVVFDRIRENLGRFKGKNIEWIANYSILETMRRSIATSATVAITLTALFIFGGASIKWFVLALLIGVISGTYSSVFNATPILVIWENFLSRRIKK
jgi:preprotein translocase subunit SecF